MFFDAAVLVANVIQVFEQFLEENNFALSEGLNSLMHCAGSIMAFTNSNLLVPVVVGLVVVSGSAVVAATVVATTEKHRKFNYDWTAVQGKLAMQPFLWSGKVNKYFDTN